MKTDTTKVTELELKILQHIWEAESAVTVAQILEKWGGAQTPGYTTVLKTLQKMEKKKIVGHERSGRRYRYFSNVTREDVTRNRLSSIIDRMFSSNRLLFAEYFVKSSDFSADELDQLKAFIREKEKGENQ